jgi:hypothetical protein
MTKADMQALAQKIEDGKATSAEKLSFARALREELKTISAILSDAKKQNN